MLQVRATHTYYRGQNNNKLFKLEHCWEILQTCAKFNEPHETAKSSASVPILLDPGEFVIDRPLNVCAPFNDAVNEDSPTPTIGKRPPGRKLSKEKPRSKRQKSEDAHSSIGDRIVKSIDDMNASSAAKIAKIAAQNAEDKQLGRRLKKIQMNKERIQSIKAIIEVETRLMEYDEKIYSKQPCLIGSPNDAMRRFAARHARIEHLTAQAQVLTMRRTIQKKTEEKDSFAELLVAIASLQEDGPYPVIWSCVNVASDLLYFQGNVVRQCYDPVF
ncbi:hypothetical protein Droror1_Dr00007217 [Drosera rotundifolia]